MLALVDLVKPLGAAGNAVADSDGRIGYAGPSGLFRNVDNTLLVFGLQLGWLLALIFGGFLAVIFWKAWAYIRGPFSVAVLSQLGAVATVAMITQYASLLWLTIGLFAAWSRLKSQDSSFMPFGTEQTDLGFQSPKMKADLLENSWAPLT